MKNDHTKQRLEITQLSPTSPSRHHHLPTLGSFLVPVSQLEAYQGSQNPLGEV